MDVSVITLCRNIFLYDIRSTKVTFQNSHSRTKAKGISSSMSFFDREQQSVETVQDEDRTSTFIYEDSNAIFGSRNFQSERGTG